MLDATQVTVTDTAAGRASEPTLDFPRDADALVDRIHGVIAAGVWWTVTFKPAAVSARPAASGVAAQLGLPVSRHDPGGAAPPAARRWPRAPCSTSSTNPERSRWRSSARAAASQLGISDLADQPAIFIEGQPFTVIGIIASDARLPAAEPRGERAGQHRAAAVGPPAAQRRPRRC